MGNQLPQLQSLELLYLASIRYDTIYAVNNSGADQTARMRRLICAFIVRIWHKTGFLMTWLICSHDVAHMFCSHNKKNIVAERHLETLYILVGQVGKNPLSPLDNEKIMIFDANEGKFYFPEVP